MHTRHIGAFFRYTMAGAILLLWSYGMTPRAMATHNIHGTKWGPPEFGTPAVVTWGLMPTGASSGDSGSITALADFMPAGYKTQIDAAFDAWSQVANITFVEMADVDVATPDIRVGGHFFDGLGGTAAHAYYPSSFSGGDVHFDTGEDWVLEYGNISQGQIKQNVFSVAMHEIGHSIGLEHVQGVFSVMNTPPSTTEFYQALMPEDIASAQYIYGPAPGYVAPPAANTTLTLTPNSSLEFTLSLFDGAVSMTDTASVTGTLDAWIDHDGPGNPAGLAIRDSTIGLSDLVMAFNNPSLSVDATLTAGGGYAFSTKNLAIGPGGEFDVGGTMFGLLDGDLATEIDLLGQMISGNVDLFNIPLALNVPDGQETGSIVETPTGDPSVFDVLLQIPVSMSSLVDASLFSDAIEPGQLSVGLSIEGLLEATGQVTIVPEPSAVHLAISAAALLVGLIASRRRTTRQ